MISAIKLLDCRKAAGMSVGELAEQVAQGGKSVAQTRAMLSNWERGLMKPSPQRAEIERVARSLGVSYQDLVVWQACHHHAPMAPRKVRLVADLIRGRSAQDALDVLKFANKRAAVLVDKVLRSAIANADEEEADVERLFVCEARVDEGPVRQGTKRWRPKDRGRAVPVTRLSSHIRVSVDLE